MFLSEFKEELRASRNLLFPIWICTKVLFCYWLYHFLYRLSIVLNLSNSAFSLQVCLSVVLGNVMFFATLFLLISLSQTVRYSFYVFLLQIVIPSHLYQTIRHILTFSVIGCTRLWFDQTKTSFSGNSFLKLPQDIPSSNDGMKLWIFFQSFIDNFN